MSKLFETCTINGMNIPNRFIRSATWEGMATEEGAVTPRLIEVMNALVSGGVGLIITGHSYIMPEGQATPLQLGVYKDDLIPGLREMTESVHQKGGKIVMQLAHSGNFAPAHLTKQAPWVVSNFEGLSKSPRKEMSVQDIKIVVKAFGEAARRAKSAGFDGIQIHSGHGYLFSQFLSPIYNKRKDEYGGDIRNRTRVHLETYQAIRNAVGKDYPVLIKMNCRDFAENGLTVEESLQAAKLLAEAGFDAIELSGGMLNSPKLSPTRMGINSEDKEAYFREDARLFKKEVNIPLILVGGVRSFDLAEKLVEEGVTDYISMCRPFIREPDLIKRWKAGDRRKSECKSDNLCFTPAFEGKGVYCVAKKN